ncbi:MAG: hypothetical protein CMJ83_00010 [Planctomycetes bacterium]|nr:hypothetical protein [Planctomycetota bacterium]
MTTSSQEAALRALRDLHGEVDRDAARLAAHHESRIHCARGCADCCVDDLTVFEVEAENIRERFPAVLAENRPHPPGRCAFLDSDGACRIYEARPYVCRTQGLPLLGFTETPEGEITESRDICPLNAEGEPLDALPHAEMWLLGTVELRLQRVQAGFGDPDDRVALRDLLPGV